MKHVFLEGRQDKPPFSDLHGRVAEPKAHQKAPVVFAQQSIYINLNESPSEAMQFAIPLYS